MNSKILTYMGFAKKAGKLVSGTNTVTFNIAKKKVRLVIIPEDISENSRKKIMKEVRKGQVEYIECGTIDELSRATGTSGRSVFAILDDNFAQVIKKAACEDR